MCLSLLLWPCQVSTHVQSFQLLGSLTAESKLQKQHEMRMHDVAQGPCLRTQTSPQCSNAFLLILEIHCTLDNSALT